eukprot:5030754-Amphidinium_carterae.1
MKELLLITRGSTKERLLIIHVRTHCRGQLASMELLLITRACFKEFLLIIHVRTHCRRRLPPKELLLIIRGRTHPRRRLPCKELVRIIHGEGAIDEGVQDHVRKVSQLLHEWWVDRSDDQRPSHWSRLKLLWCLRQRTAPPPLRVPRENPLCWRPRQIVSLAYFLDNSAKPPAINKRAGSSSQRRP